MNTTTNNKTMVPSETTTNSCGQWLGTAPLVFVPQTLRTSGPGTASGRLLPVCTPRTTALHQQQHQQHAQCLSSHQQTLAALCGCLFLCLSLPPSHSALRPSPVALSLLPLCGAAKMRVSPQIRGVRGPCGKVLDGPTPVALHVLATRGHGSRVWQPAVQTSYAAALAVLSRPAGRPCSTGKRDSRKKRRAEAARD